MSNEVTTFLRKQALENQYTVFDEVFGTIELDNTTPIKQSSGAVYGIFVKSNDEISPKVKQIPDLDGFYPVYWGKDITPVKRIAAHIQNYKDTGTANLKGSKEIQGKVLVFGAIFVSNYKNFEEILHNNFPPLIGISKPGKSSIIVEIIN